MRINTNIGALTAANNLTRVNDALRSSTEKLSSGFRINKAADDAAGLGVANLFRADIRSLTQAQRNAEQAAAVYQIAEGGAQSIQSMLERMKELASQSAADAVDDNSRLRIQKEFKALQDEIERTTQTTEFGGVLLLRGGYGASTTMSAALAPSVGTIATTGTIQTVTFAASDTLITATSTTGISQTLGMSALTAAVVNFTALGVTFNRTNATSATMDTLKVTTVGSSGSFLVGAAHAGGGYSSGGNNTLAITGSDLDLRTSTLTVASGGVNDVLTRTKAENMIAKIDVAIGLVSDALGVIGAGQNRLTTAIDNVKSTILNYQAAESSIRDLDMAAEMVKFSKNQILAQAGTAMLAQANQSGQGILKLLQ